MQSIDAKVIQDWIIVISTAVTLLTTAAAAWVGVLQYRLKVREERRSQESSRVEIDIRLSTLFTDLMSVAHARGRDQLSEKCIEELFRQGLISKDDFDDPDSLSKKLEAACILTFPVGNASQNAAIASIAVLGQRYEVLREPAREGLRALREFKQAEVDRCLSLLERS